MGLPITVPSSYTGYSAVALTDYNTEQLESYITKYEPYYLIDLLGITLYNLFVADLDGNGIPQSARFLTIYNALSIADPCYYKRSSNYFKFGYYWFGSVFSQKQLKSEGIKEMLKNFIWFHYSRDQRFQSQQNGVNVQTSETSRESNPNEFSTLTEQRYNGAVSSYQAIRAYMMDNLSTYPELTGEDKEYLMQ